MSTAGKVLALDKLAAQFYSAVSTDRSAIIEKAQAYINSLTGSAQESAKRAVVGESTGEYYVKAMQRVVEKGEGWLVKETARYVVIILLCYIPYSSHSYFRIGKLLESPSLSVEKLDELQRKNNILSAFAHKKYDEAADYLSDASLEDVEDAVRHATASVKVAAGQATERIKQEL